MSSEFEIYDTKAMAPVYGGRPATILATGLPCDELCRGLNRARALRKAHFKACISRFTRRADGEPSSSDV